MASLLKIVHYLAFAVGLGGGVANAMIGMQLHAAAPAARAGLGAAQKRIGQIGLAALVLVWASGLALVWGAYGGTAGLGVAFWLKMAAVVALTLAVAVLTVQGARAERAGTGPDAATMARLEALATGSAVAAVVLAVVAFAG
ncbi:MAG: hypothetical protein KJZ85_17740 [Rhodobacteraceae bacterium]|jgi:hypothetical protein|nr:hypothetical protein [Paracoccaceae bacterium]